MGKASRNEKLAVILSCQFYGDVLAESGRAFPDVHGYIQDRTGNHPDEFGLGMLAFLEMKASHDSVGRFAFIVLDEVDMSDTLFEILEVE